MRTLKEYIVILDESKKPKDRKSSVNKMGIKSYKYTISDHSSQNPNISGAGNLQEIKEHVLQFGSKPINVIIYDLDRQTFLKNLMTSFRYRDEKKVDRIGRLDAMLAKALGAHGDYTQGQIAYQNNIIGLATKPIPSLLLVLNKKLSHGIDNMNAYTEYPIDNDYDEYSNEYDSSNQDLYRDTRYK